MRDEISQADIMTAFLQAVLDYGQPEMAAHLNVAVSTLSNKLQPYDSPERRHYLNLLEADSILTVKRDYRALELLAARHGFVLLPMAVTPDAATAAEEALQDIQDMTAYQAEKNPVKRVHLMNSLFRNVMETEAKRREEEAKRGKGKP